MCIAFSQSKRFPLFNWHYIPKSLPVHTIHAFITCFISWRLRNTLSSFGHLHTDIFFFCNQFLQWISPVPCHTSNIMSDPSGNLCWFITLFLSSIARCFIPSSAHLLVMLLKRSETLENAWGFLRWDKTSSMTRSRNAVMIGGSLKAQRSLRLSCTRISHSPWWI